MRIKTRAILNLGYVIMLVWFGWECMLGAIFSCHRDSHFPPCFCFVLALQSGDRFGNVSLSPIVLPPACVIGQRTTPCACIHFACASAVFIDSCLIGLVVGFVPLTAC